MMAAAPVRVRFMYIGNLEAYQGIDLLLESFAIVMRTRPADRLVIIGGVAKHVAGYRQQAQRLGLGARVEFRGQQSIARLADFLGEADVLVSPRIKGTNTPMKIYSYLDSGKPIVATKLLTHTQVLTPEVAVLADPEPDAFAAAMLALAEDPARCEKLGRVGRDYVRTHFSRAAFSVSFRASAARVSTDGTAV